MAIAVGNAMDYDGDVVFHYETSTTEEKVAELYQALQEEMQKAEATSQEFLLMSDQQKVLERESLMVAEAAHIQTEDISKAEKKSDKNKQGVEKVSCRSKILQIVLVILAILFGIALI